MPKPSRVLERVRVHGQTHDLVDSLGRIDFDRLREETEEANAQSIWWGILAAKATRTFREAEVMSQTAEANAILRLSKQSVDKGFRWTDQAIKAAARADEAYLAAKKQEIEAQEAASMVESTKYACVQKAKNLEALGRLVADQVWVEQGPRTDTSVRAPRTPAQARPVRHPAIPR